MFSEILRHGKRFLLSFPLKVRMDPGSVEHTVTENISASGCYFHLSREVPIGTSLELEIKVPGPREGIEDRICCRGKVVRVDRRPASDGRVGVATTIDSYHFGKISREARNRTAAAYVQ
ncbi:MAG: PilZ domain-containing protein [Terriglobia bacterium]